MSLRSSAKTVARLIAHPLTLLSVAAIAVAAIVWFVLPLLAFGDARPFEDVSSRLAILLCIVLVAAIAAVWIAARPANADRRLVEGLRRQEAEAQASDGRTTEAVERRVADFRRRIVESTARMSRGRSPWRRRQAAYRLPWYLVIGPGGAGKTAFLLDAGLDLPFGSPRGLVAGQPTVDGEVLVSDGAVFVEASGALAIEAPDRPADRSVFTGLLEALRRHRARQPVCGILLLVDLPSVLALDEEARRHLAKTLRRRLDETAETFRARPPVYVLFTKLDELVGFNAFFETLDRAEREQHLGFTLLTGEADTTYQTEERIGAHAHALARRVAAHELPRLQDEADVRQRSLIHEFPAQFAAAVAELVPFLAILAFPHQFDPPPFVRGVFFTSGRQNASAVDLVGRAIGSGYGQRHAFARPADTDADHSRPFFLRTLIRDLVPGEAATSGLSQHARRVSLARRIAVGTAIVLVVIGTFWQWAGAYRAAGTYADATSQRARDIRQSIGETRFGDRLPPFREILPILDNVRALAEKSPSAEARSVDRVEDLEARTRETYAQTVDRLFVPYLVEGLQVTLADGGTAPADLFQQLKLYLALGGVRPIATIDLDEIAPVLDRAWLTGFSPPQRASFIRHLLALGTSGAGERTIDPGLVAEVRNRIADYTLAQLAFDLTRTRPEIVALPGFRPSDNAGGAGARVLARVGGESLFVGPPGLFTREPFRETVLPALRDAADRIQSDAWVLAEDGRSRSIDTDAVYRGVLSLFSAEYIRVYDTLLSELTVLPMITPQDGARIVRVAITTPSPVSELVASIAAETDLSLPPPTPEEAALASATLAATRAARARGVPGSVLVGSRNEPDPGLAITEAFAGLRRAATPAGDNPSELDLVLRTLDPLYRQLNHIATGGNVLELGAEPQAALAQIASAIDGLPPSAQPLLRRMSEAGFALVNGNSGERLRSVWESTVLPACVAATRNRFPFDAGSRSDTPFEDLTTMFGPTGQIAAFRDTYLAPSIDMSARPWRWRPGRAAALGVDEASLAAFERADAITRAFFPNGDAIGTQFTLEITSLDAQAQAARFDVGGATLRYAHGPAVPFTAQWPPATPNAPAVLSITPEQTGVRNMLVGEGSWALFRLMGQAGARRLVDGNAFDARFSVGGRAIGVRLTPSSTQNPFELLLLDGFRCPML